MSKLAETLDEAAASSPWPDPSPVDLQDAARKWWIANIGLGGSPVTDNVALALANVDEEEVAAMLAAFAAAVREGR